MDFALTKDQKMYQKAAREFLVKECSMETVRDILQEEKGYSPVIWKKISELEWLSILIDEKYDGLGGSFLDLCPILEEIGRAVFPSPFFATVIMGGNILSEEADEETKSKLLPSIANGNTIVTIAIEETEEEWSKDAIRCKAQKQGDNYVIEGTKLFVPFAAASDYIICCARPDDLNANGISLFLIDANDDRIDFTPIPSFSTEKYYQVHFKKVKVSQKSIIGTPGQGWEAIERLQSIMTAARCIEMVGGMQKVLEMTVAFVKERKQFGVPIGSQQAIQHYCAEIAIDVETSKFMAYQAAWKISNKQPCRAEVSMAKAWCGDAYQRVTALALQAHGATGFTEEYDLHLFYKQAKSLQLMSGGSSYHRKVVAQEMGLPI